MYLSMAGLELGAGRHVSPAWSMRTSPLPRSGDANPPAGKTGLSRLARGGRGPVQRMESGERWTPHGSGWPGAPAA